MLRRYVHHVPFAFLRLLLPPSHPNQGGTLQDWRLRLTHFMFQTLGDLRICEMFDIVIDYPDSAPAVVEAGRCLQHTSLQGKFVQVFKVRPGAGSIFGEILDLSILEVSR